MRDGKTGMTGRLIFRPFAAGDAPRLTVIAGDPLVCETADFPRIYNEAEAAEWIRGTLSAPGTYAVCLPDGTLIGCIGIQYFSPANDAMGAGEAEVGYWYGVPYQGKGYATEALGWLTERAFHEWGLRGLWCVCYRTNVAARRVAEKCGFVPREESTGGTAGGGKTVSLYLAAKKSRGTTVPRKQNAN